MTSLAEKSPIEKVLSLQKNPALFQWIQELENC